MNLGMLYAEFPREAVHWRAQSLTKDGTKAMALAYLDARDVMDRLDDAVRPENWQDSYFETAKGRLICTLSIRIGGEWISKSDGAGETDVEGEKGAISAALKRAAVKWGVGRYLYDMPAPWVPCESYEKGGKHHWRKWTADPWQFVRTPSKATARPEPDASYQREIENEPAPKRIRADDDIHVWAKTLLDGSSTSLPALGQAFKITQEKFKEAGLPYPQSLIGHKDKLKAEIDKRYNDFSGEDAA